MVANNVNHTKWPTGETCACLSLECKEWTRRVSVWLGDHSTQTIFLFLFHFLSFFLSVSVSFSLSLYLLDQRVTAIEPNLSISVYLPFSFSSAFLLLSLCPYSFTSVFSVFLSFPLLPFACVVRQAEQSWSESQFHSPACPENGLWLNAFSWDWVSGWRALAVMAMTNPHHHSGGLFSPDIIAEAMSTALYCTVTHPRSSQFNRILLLNKRARLCSLKRTTITMIA
jgi:hypothetical protein